MRPLHLFTRIFFSLLLLAAATTSAQIGPGVYIAEVDGVSHELKIGEDYLIHSSYSATPAKFIRTVGGFYSLADSILQVKLEFNSNHADDGLTTLSLSVVLKDNQLILPMDGDLIFKKQETTQQALDGVWLFASRGPEEGQERRGEENPRKTLKYLQDSRFQWIAYHTDTMEFFGTGGGEFTSKDGKYVESIEYFSRDDSRVGAELDFKYEIKSGDWHPYRNEQQGGADVRDLGAAIGFDDTGKTIWLRC